MKSFAKREDHFMTDIWALAVTVFWIETVPPATLYSKNHFQSLQFAHKYMELAEAIRNKKWLVDRKLNFASNPQNLDQKVVKFIDIISKMTGYDRQPVSANKSSKDTESNQNASRVTMKELVADMNLIYDSNADIRDIVDKFVQKEINKTKSYTEMLRDWAVNILGFFTQHPEEKEKFENQAELHSELGDYSSNFDFIAGNRVI